MIKRFSIFCLAWSVGVGVCSAHVRARTPVHLPDILGYQTLKCDFHIHTVFSDGSVWPDIRSEEAWREGLDAIAITDHIEYQPHRADLPTDHNRPFQIARPRGESLAVTVIPGSEITRSMPPGHLNAIFLKDAALLKTETWQDAVQAAADQGAFIFWNHPGWTGQQSDGVARWYQEHSELLDQGRLHGIEVVNERSYYPEAHQWALDKNLTLLSNSDIHLPIQMDYDLHEGDHRPITLVFARDRSSAAIHEALKDRRTVVYAGNRLIGEERFLAPLFHQSITVLHSPFRLAGTRGYDLQIRNDSDVGFDLELVTAPAEVTVPKRLTLPPGRIVLFPVKAVKGTPEGDYKARARYRITNLLVAPDTPLETEVVLPFSYSP